MQPKEHVMTRGAWIFLTVIALFFILMLPVWPYSIAWGYYPAGGVFLLSLIFVGLILAGAFAIISADETDTNFDRDLKTDNQLRRDKHDRIA